MKKKLFQNYICSPLSGYKSLIMSKGVFSHIRIFSFSFNKHKKRNLISLSFSSFSDHNKLTLDKYLQETHNIFEYIYDKLDCQDLDIIDNIDLTEGVLNIKFKSGQSYVLNIQRPNLQIWLSSPISGPQRFEYDQDKEIWLNIRNSLNLLNILNEEFNKIIKENNGKEISL